MAQWIKNMLGDFKVTMNSKLTFF